jgi:protein SCO1/2
MAAEYIDRSLRGHERQQSARGAQDDTMAGLDRIHLRFEKKADSSSAATTGAARNDKLIVNSSPFATSKPASGSTQWVAQRSLSSFVRSFCLLLLLPLCAVPVLAQMVNEPKISAQTLPPDLGDVSIEQKLNAQVPLDLPFRDEFGREVKLGDYFVPNRPVILALVYYDCPMLCTEVLNGLASSLRILKFDPGKEYEVVTVSFDPKEKPELALAKKTAYIKRLGRSGAQNGWHFLTGDQASIKALTEAVGFHYAWDPKMQQYAHATSIEVLTPTGKIAQYYYGIEYSPKDLRLGLVEASQNKIGTVVDQLLLFCYHYDPKTGKYGAIVTRILRIAGAATIVILGSFLFFMLRSERKARPAGGATAYSSGRT